MVAYSSSLVKDITYLIISTFNLTNGRENSTCEKILISN